MKNVHPFAALTSATRALQARPVTTPQGTNLADLINRLPHLQDFNNRFNVPLEQELLLRLDEFQSMNHYSRIEDIVAELGAQGTWDAICRNRDFEGRYGLFRRPEDKLSALMAHDFLPVDSSVFDLGAAYPDILAKVLDRSKKLSIEQEDVTGQTKLVDHWVAQDDEPLSNIVWHIMRAVTGLTDENLEKVVTLAEKRFADGTAQFFVLRDIHFWFTKDQEQRLIARNTPGAYAVLFHDAWVHQEIREQVAQTPLGQAVLLRQTHKVEVDIEDLPVEYLNREGAENLLKAHVTFVDDDQLLTVVKRASQGRTWLLGNLPQHKPTADRVRRALELGVTDARELYYIAPYVTSFDWPQQMLPEVPGLAAELLKDLDESGDTLNTPSEDTMTRQSIVLSFVARELGDDIDMWDRFLSAGEKSPFRGADLTIAEAIAVFRSRWEQARSRKR